jgi:hypothetical protein
VSVPLNALSIILLRCHPSNGEAIFAELQIFGFHAGIEIELSTGFGLGGAFSGTARRTNSNSTRIMVLNIWAPSFVIRNPKASIEAVFEALK